jgi:hypothetical protein
MAQICTRVSVSYRGHKNSGSGSVVKLLMRDEVIAVNIAKLTDLLKHPSKASAAKRSGKPATL